MKSFLFILAAITLFSCSTDQKNNQSPFTGIELRGEAQGTTYSIKYLDVDVNYKKEVDSILLRFDQDLSNWTEGSLINRINAYNRRDTVFAFVDSTKFFSVVFDLSREVYNKTDGAFDPSVYPLVQAWGFGLKNKEHIDQYLIDSLLQNVGFTEFDIDLIEKYRDNYFYEETNIWKGNPNVQLDFNAISQGYSIDVLADFFLEKKIENFMIELGGEVYCHGVNHLHTPWKIAIDKPLENNDHEQLEAIVPIHNAAIATSGNYRKFYIENGKKYAHTINPKTGYPVQHNLLSTTVITSSCAIADAYATAFMVMGVDQTVQFLKDHPELKFEVYLIYDDGGNFESVITEGLSKIIQIIPED